MENETKQQPQPRNIFEAINKNIVDMSQDNVAMFEMMRGMAEKFDQMAVKVEQIHAALYPVMPNEIPEGSPKNPGEEEGFENE